MTHSVASRTLYKRPEISYILHFDLLFRLPLLRTKELPLLSSAHSRPLEQKLHEFNRELRNLHTTAILKALRKKLSIRKHKTSKDYHIAYQRRRVTRYSNARTALYLIDPFSTPEHRRYFNSVLAFDPTNHEIIEIVTEGNVGRLSGSYRGLGERRRHFQSSGELTRSFWRLDSRIDGSGFNGLVYDSGSRRGPISV